MNEGLRGVVGTPLRPLPLKGRDLKVASCYVRNPGSGPPGITMDCGGRSPSLILRYNIGE